MVEDAAMAEDKPTKLKLHVNTNVEELCGIPEEVERIGPQLSEMSEDDSLTQYASPYTVTRSLGMFEWHPRTETQVCGRAYAYGCAHSCVCECKQRHAHRRVYGAVSHGLLPGRAFDRDDAAPAGHVCRQCMNMYSYMCVDICAFRVRIYAPAGMSTCPCSQASKGEDDDGKASRFLLLNHAWFQDNLRSAADSIRRALDE